MVGMIVLKDVTRDKLHVSIIDYYS